MLLRNILQPPNVPASHAVVERCPCSTLGELSKVVTETLEALLKQNHPYQLPSGTGKLGTAASSHLSEFPVTVLFVWQIQTPSVGLRHWCHL
jgi:hypothetical protein